MLANIITVLALGAVASAQTFVGFPKTLTCQVRDAPDGIITTEQMETAVGSARRVLSTPNGADMNTRYCRSLRGIPIYSIHLVGQGTFYFAENTATNTVTFCDSIGDIVDFSIGYPDRCKEAY